MSLACIIRSVLYSEYYKRNSYPNTQQILASLNSELSALKEIGSFYSQWLNSSLSKPELLLHRLSFPQHPSFMRSVEQHVNDLLDDNDSPRRAFKHSCLDKNLTLLVNQK